MAKFNINTSKKYFSTKIKHDKAKKFKDKAKKFKDKILELKLYTLAFQSIFLLFICYFKSIFATNWANIQENFYTGFVFLASSVYIPRFFEKNYF